MSSRIQKGVSRLKTKHEVTEVVSLGEMAKSSTSVPSYFKLGMTGTGYCGAYGDIQGLPNAHGIYCQFRISLGCTNYIVNSKSPFRTARKCTVCSA